MASADVALPDGYSQTLDVLKRRVREARVRAQRSVNTELIELYWNIGNEILIQRQRQGWGTGVVRQLADDLRAEFPDMTGLSYRNLQYMRALAAAGNDDQPIVQQPAAQLPWGHIMVLIDKLDDVEALRWYAAAAVEYGWTRDVLLNMIKNQSMQRTGVAPSNFTQRLSAPDSELAQQVAKDPYAF